MNIKCTSLNCCSQAHVHRNKDLTQENDMASNKTRMQVIMPNLKRV